MIRRGGPLAILCVLCACTTTDPTPDTTSPPASTPPPPDAPPPDASDQVDSPKHITFHALGLSGGPQGGLRVLLHDSKGAIVADGVTDPAGNATLVARASHATVFFTRRTLLTYLDVEDNDVLTVADTAYPQLGFDTYSYSATLPGPFDQAVDASVGVAGNDRLAAGPYVAVGSTAGPVNVSTSAAGAHTLIAAARDQNQRPIAYAVAKAPEGGMNLSPATAVAFDAWAAPVTTTLALSNQPKKIATYAALHIVVGDESFPVWPTRSTDGAPGYAFDAFRQVFVSGLDWPVPAGLADSMQTVVISEVVSQVSYAVLTRRSPFSATASLDGASELPAIQWSSVSSSGLAWSVSTPPNGADAFLARVQCTMPTGDRGSDTTTWMFLAPPSRTDVPLPAIPPELNSGCQAWTQGDLALVDREEVAGYDEFRRLTHGVVLFDKHVNALEVLQSNGMKRMSLQPAQAGEWTFLMASTP